MSGEEALAPSAREESPPLWRHLDLGRCDPLRAQAFVESVAESVAAGEVPNTLLTAQPNAPYVSLGFHQSFSEEIDEGFLARRRVPVLRRVEGGGTTWLDADQWFYQLAYREEGGGPGGPADLVRFLSAPVAAARQLGLAAELRAPSDLVVGERKVSGNAGGDWEGAHLLVGGILGRADHRAMADLLKLPHPAIRPILRAEIERRVTSWEAETGSPPAYGEWRDHLVEAFRGEGLFRSRPGRPTPAEETRFRTETTARHGDPSWRELPPVARAPGPVVRRLRIAGPHGLLVLSASGADRFRVAVVDGSAVREAYVVDAPPGREGPRRLGEGTDEFAEVSRDVANAPGFG